MISDQKRASDAGKEESVYKPDELIAYLGATDYYSTADSLPRDASPSDSLKADSALKIVF